MVGPDLAANPRLLIEEALLRANVELRLATRIERVERDAVFLNSGERLLTRTVIVTAGQQASPFAWELPVEG